MQLFVDRLTVIDMSYLHPLFGIEGESWICDVVLDGILDDQSMVMDFGDVKKRIKQAIDSWTDHTLIVPKHSPHLVAFDEQNGEVYLRWQCVSGDDVQHRSPAGALCLLDASEVTPLFVKEYLERRLMEVVQETVQAVHITLYPEPSNAPYYHYSHALKKHGGNCQRIAHGHRSKIEIWRDGKPDNAAMQKWAEAWKHIYVGSHEDIRDSYVEQGIAYYHFSYLSGQGTFALDIAQQRCVVLDCDSTVECIAQHIARELKAAQPESTFHVKAYEGVQKGAIAVA